eukprot:7357409-Prymnesium_polylepis.1
MPAPRHVWRGRRCGAGARVRSVYGVSRVPASPCGTARCGAHIDVLRFTLHIKFAFVFSLVVEISHDLCASALCREERIMRRARAPGSHIYTHAPGHTRRAGAQRRPGTAHGDHTPSPQRQSVGAQNAPRPCGRAGDEGNAKGMRGTRVGIFWDLGPLTREGHIAKRLLYSLANQDHALASHVSHRRAYVQMFRRCTHPITVKAFAAPSSVWALSSLQLPALSWLVLAQGPRNLADGGSQAP